MGYLNILFLVLSLTNALGYVLEPSLTWPENYHFNAEEINLVTSIVKPFEIWYSTQHNRSRISLYGGTVSRFYYGMYVDDEGEEHDSKIYMIHPEVSEDDSTTEVKCEMHYNWDDDFEDFLPDMSDLIYSGEEEHGGKTLQVWKREEVEDSIRKLETLLVLPKEDGVGIPVHHYFKKYQIDTGELEGNKVINYFNYETKVALDDLDPHRPDCDSWDSFNRDLDSALKVLLPSIESDVDMAFHRYKKYHNRAYAEEEHALRRAIFKRRWELVEEHNKKNVGYTLALNQFADRTRSELAYLSGMKVQDPIREGTMKFPHTEEELNDIANEIPENFDLRSLGVITPVRNQAHCGSCWAFAAASTMEGVLARATGRLLDLSEQSLVDCAWRYQSHGCEGTQAIDAVFEYLQTHGIPTVEEYGPYLEEDGFCHVNNMTKLYTIKGYVGVTKSSVNALKAAIYKYGPVTIGVQVTEKMMFYKSGILFDFECEPGAMNHAVTLTGYGVRDGTPYWIIKNSWGEIWGESGYMLISAVQDNCNVMHSPYYPVV